uniref:Uncharacterized protein n=1 Tax=Panagrellus redivivus TaxID=6233 RepID=A0A7E4VWP3_PANRE
MTRLSVLILSLYLLSEVTDARRYKLANLYQLMSTGICEQDPKCKREREILLARRDKFEAEYDAKAACSPGLTENILNALFKLACFLSPVRYEPCNVPVE